MYDKNRKIISQRANKYLPIARIGKLLHPRKKGFAIPVNFGSKIVFVQCSIITYCVAKDGYVSLITDEGKEYVCNLTLKQLEERLPDRLYSCPKVLYSSQRKNRRDTEIL